MKPLAATPFETLSLWVLLHLVLLSAPFLLAFLIRSRGRLHLRHYAVGIPILAVIMAAAVPCLGVLSRPGAFPLLAALLWQSKVTAIISLMISCGWIALMVRKGRATRSGIISADPRSSRPPVGTSIPM